jgi:hypothetical protein
MGKIMQWSAFRTAGITGTTEPPQRWTQGAVFERPFCARRGMPLSNATNNEVIVERVLSAADLDGAMRDQLARILIVTVRDWVQK